MDYLVPLLPGGAPVNEESQSGQQGGSPPSGDGSILSSAEVRDAEIKCIIKRRDAALGDERKSVRHNLIGLAHSGGGLRSATFTLGLLQAFRNYGLLKYIDYQCSISGGGYTAGYLARATHDDPRFHRADGEAGEARQGVARIARAPGALSKVDHLRFRDCGDYLRRPVEFLAEYIFCTALVLALFISGLMAIALAIAIFWRTFDVNVVVDHFGIIGWNVELFTAFIPCLALLFLWVVLEAGDRLDGACRQWAFSSDSTGQSRRRYGGCIASSLGVFLGSMIIMTRDMGAWVACAPLLGILAATSLSFALIATGRWFDRRLRWLKKRSTFLGPTMLGVACILCAIPFVVSFVPNWDLPKTSAIAYSHASNRYELNARSFTLVVFGFAAFCFFVTWAVLGVVRLKRVVFLALLFSPLVGIIILIANGSLSLGWIGQAFGVGAELSSQQFLREPLVAFVLLCVFVLFRYKRLLQSARPQAGFWDRVAFNTVVSGIVVGVPIILIGCMGREGISGYAAFRDPDLTYSDILDWRAFEDLWHDKDLGGVEPLAGRLSLPESLVSAITEVREAGESLLGKPSWDRNRHSIFDPTYGWLARSGLLLQHELSPLRSDPNKIQSPVQAYLAALDQQRKEQKLFCEKQAQDWLQSQSLAMKLKEEIRLRSLNKPGDKDDNEITSCDALLTKLASPMAEGGRLLTYYHQATDHLKHSEAKRDDGTTGPDLSFDFQSEYWDEYNRKSFNRLMLEALYPGIFKARTLVSTAVVIEEDQITRVRYLALVGLPFLALFALLPVNGLSPFHNFYRRKLESEFLGSTIEAAAPPAEGRRQRSAPQPPLNLAELKSHENGGPYPLFMAALHFVHEQVTDERGAEERSLRGRCVSFLMSPKFCGTREFGYMSTNEYPWRNFGLGEAVAISGAALSPLAFSTGPIYWILSAFNLRTGQWIARPDCAATTKRMLPYVRPCDIYREFFESGEAPEGASGNDQRQWTVGSAADGGYCDYLGIEPLLERRCRLIIVADAGCNQGEEEFQSLGDVVRRIRLEQDIEILDWDDNRPLDIDRLRRDEKTRLSPQHFLMGRIVYPDDDQREGVLVYIQMAMSGDEGVDLLQHHRAHDTFPNEPTPNQFFSPAEVELFRTLGFHTGESLCLELGDVAACRLGREDATEFLIQRISDVYALAGSAERKVDELDFRSRLPFAPEVASKRLRRFRAHYPRLDDSQGVRRTVREARCVRRFEQRVEYRRYILLDVEAAIDGLHMNGERNNIRPK